MEIYRGTEEGEGRERALGKLTGELTFLDLGCGKAREESGAAAAADGRSASARRER
jgi:hypothetical protein